MTQYAHIVLSWLILSCYLCHHASGNSDISTINCVDSERKALLQFKDGITDDSCGLLTSWWDDSDCCQWRGVHCSNYTGHVIMLRLQGSRDFYFTQPCLEGNLSSSLGELKHLRHLNLNFNYFVQPSLDFLGSLATLEHLSLRYSFKYTGETLPQGESLRWLSRLRLLRYIDLSGADLSAAKNWTQIVSRIPFLGDLHMNECQLPVSIPSSLAHINSSSNLRVISLNTNQIKDNFIFKWLFNLPGITQLKYLDLSFISLEGSIPNGFGNLRHLSHLDLSNNYLKGPIPNDFGNLEYLSHLDLSNNNLEGLIPAEFQSMHSLSYLSLSKNNLQGSVFKIFTRLCSLQQLYLKGNNFTDELKNVIRALLSCENTALRTLDLSKNRFWGAIPDTISSFSLLRELYLDSNQLNGKLTQAIGQLSMLEKLYISSNSLSATLTHTFFANFSRLRELYLSDNTKIVINIDESWDPPFQLDKISLRSCKLGPYFPNWLKMQTNFSHLDVSNAEISGNIPISFWNSLSFNLEYLNMSYNQFHGSVPNLPQTFDFFFAEVDLSSNLFEGAIPSWFGNLSYLYLNDNRFSDFTYILCPKTASSLEIIDLSNNLLSGELPDCWMSFDELSSLHLENNRIYGNIPKSIGNLNDLKYLNLQNNSFSGVIPASMENCTNLIILNLGYNSFSGNIPPWIGNIKGLGALTLRRNKFLGEVPVSLCQLSHLQILDFAMNHISGVIPGCIGNFMAMTRNNDSWLFVGIDGVIFNRGPYTIVNETYKCYMEKGRAEV